jgi:hypothetical protein
MKSLQTKPPPPPTLDERHQMIAIAAYYLAESRGFAPGEAEQDWLRAERVIDLMITDWTSIEAWPGSDPVQRIRNALMLRATVGAEHELTRLKHKKKRDRRRA